MPDHGLPLALQLLAIDRADLAVAVVQAVEQSSDDPLAREALAMHLALAQAKAGQTAAAVHRLLRIEQFGSDLATQAHAARLRCVVHLSAAESEPAVACARQLLGARADGQALAELALDPDRRAWRAGLASALVPGLGQLWAGEPGLAAGALVVNGSLVGGTVALIADAAYGDAVLLAVTMTLRYYVGNIEHAAAAARRDTLARQRRAAQTLLRQLVVP